MIGVWFVFGVGIGILNYWMQWRSVNGLHSGASRIGVIRVVGGGALRCVLIAVLLLAIFHQGFIPGLIAFAGFWLTRLGLILRLGLVPLPNSTSQNLIKD